MKMIEKCIQKKDGRYYLPPSFFINFFIFLLTNTFFCDTIRISVVKKPRYCRLKIEY